MEDWKNRRLGNTSRGTVGLQWPLLTLRAAVPCSRRTNKTRNLRRTGFRDQSKFPSMRDRTPSRSRSRLLERPKAERRREYHPSPVIVSGVAAEMVVGTLIVDSVIVHLILTRPRRSAKHCDGSTHRNGLKKRYRLFLGHSDASVRSRVTRQVTRMKPYPGSKLHEIAHGRLDESSPCRLRHVNIRI